ncbi:MAG: hypothetical protein K0S11_637 [Gammaproteobacteria bacterium]|nr:hypothetical protein [Gammaproteobacteria bacterium]
MPPKKRPNKMLLSAISLGNIIPQYVPVVLMQYQADTVLVLLFCKTGFTYGKA